MSSASLTFRLHLLMMFMTGGSSYYCLSRLRGTVHPPGHAGRLAPIAGAPDPGLTSVQFRDFGFGPSGFRFQAFRFRS